MSTFISFAFPQQPAYLLTDGAVWDAADQTLAFVRCKAFRAKRAPLAVTARGHLAVVEKIQEEICNRADILGTAETIATLQAFADGLRDRPGISADQGGAHFLVSAFIEGKGAVARSFSTYQRDRRLATGEDVTKRTPFEVWDPGMVYWSGTPMRTEDVERAGLFPKPNEPIPAFVRRAGLGMMEIMRGRPGTIDGKPVWCVGGHVDLTTIDARGARTETLRTWPDVIGEPIDPTRKAA